MSDDLQTIVPEPILVVVRGETLEIKQIRVGQISKAMRIAYPFYERLKEAKDAAKKSKSEEAYGFDIYSLVMENTDAILDMVALLCSKDRAWVDDIGIEELVALFSAIVEVNLDFFTQRVLPLLSGLVTTAISTPKIQESAGAELSNP